MSEFSQVARPYAKAVFEFALERQRFEPQALVQWQEMLTFAAQVSGDRQMVDLLSARLAAEKMAEIFNTVCLGKLDQHGQNLIRIMAHNGRLAALPAVLEQFIELHQSLMLSAEAEVTSAYPLSAVQQTQISAALQKHFTKTITLRCCIDQSIIAGITIQIGDWLVDSSIRGRLNRLATQLQV